MSRPLVLCARWVLPVVSPPIEQGAVRINAAGRIDAIGPARELVSADVQQHDLGNAALLPGLVNVHAHPELAAFRGLLDDLPFHQWIPTLKRCRIDAALTDEDFELAARWTCVEALRAGITTLGATESSGAAAGAVHDAGLRGIVYLETFGPSPAQLSESMVDLRARLARVARYRNDRVQVGVSPHAAYTVSDVLYLAVADLARAEELPVATHAAEAEAEDLLIRQGAGPFAAGLRTRGIATPPRGESAIELLDRLGVLALRPLLIHCARLSADDLQRIAGNDAAIAHCPIANARLGHGIAPVLEAREAGIRVGIGTDSVASNNRLDLLEEARVAQLLQRARHHSSGALAGAELLRLCTIEGARALDLDARIGTLAPGKDADLCALALDRPHTTPLGDLENALFHAARGSDIVLTMVQGRVLYDGSAVTTLNEAELQTGMTALAHRLRRARAQAT
ncbi:MAG: amidohydrolase family protein [Longimicrobiales bacterium]